MKKEKIIKYFLQRQSENNSKIWLDVYEHVAIESAEKAKHFLTEDCPWNVYRVIKREIVETVIE